MKQPFSDQTKTDNTLAGLKSSLTEKLSSNLRNRESLNSSGTVSRKTSTASEYTPEHTYVTDLRPSPPLKKDSASVSATDGAATPSSEEIHKENDDELKAELKDSLMKGEVKLVPGQKVDVKMFILKPEEVVEEAAKADEVETAVETKPTECKNQESALKVPQRKISRFLVSPVLSGQLDVPKDKEIGVEPVPEPPKEAQSSEIKQEASRKNSGQLEPAKPVAELEKIVEQKPSVTSVKEEAVKEEQSAPVCGPEMINTLEQLKISLDNLKHSGHPTHKKEPSESDSKKDVTSTATVPKSQPQPVQNQQMLNQPVAAQSPQPQQQAISQPQQSAPVQNQPTQPVMQPQHQQMPQIVQQFQQITHSQPVTPPICQPNSIPMSSQAQHIIGPPSFTTQALPHPQPIQPQNVLNQPLPQISQVN